MLVKPRRLRTRQSGILTLSLPNEKSAGKPTRGVEDYLEKGSGSDGFGSLVSFFKKSSGR